MDMNRKREIVTYETVCGFSMFMSPALSTHFRTYAFALKVPSACRYDGYGSTSSTRDSAESAFAGGKKERRWRKMMLRVMHIKGGKYTSMTIAASQRSSTSLVVGCLQVMTSKKRGGKKERGSHSAT